MFALAKMALWLLAFSGTVRHGMKAEGWSDKVGKEGRKMIKEVGWDSSCLYEEDSIWTQKRFRGKTKEMFSISSKCDELRA